LRPEITFRKWSIKGHKMYNEKNLIVFLSKDKTNNKQHKAKQYETNNKQHKAKQYETNNTSAKNYGYKFKTKH
jgi:hypothetical protein